MRVEFVQRTTAVIPKARIRRALTAAARHLRLPQNCDVSVCSMAGRTMQQLNAVYRGKSNVPDVLSFPQFTGAKARARVRQESAKSPRVPLGDIMINMKKLTAEAPLSGRKMANHVEAMVVHSFLHLLGYDHERARQARSMERLEHAILHLGRA